MKRKIVSGIAACIVCVICIASMFTLVGCEEKDGNNPAEIAPTAEVTMTLVDEYHAEAVAVLDAFVKKEIDSAEALDKLADINREIWDLSYEEGATPHSEQDGLDIMSGEIEDFRSYIADYSVEQASMGVIKDRFKDFKKNDFNAFNK